MGDVGLGVELLLLIDTNLDFSGRDRLNDSVETLKKRIIDAFWIKGTLEYFQSSLNRRRRLTARLGADKNPDFVDFLPIAIESQESTDFEIPSCYINRF